MKFVPKGHVLQYGYAKHGKIRFQQYGGQQWEAVRKHAAFLSDYGDNGSQPADCPFGYWDGDIFVIQDGRHRYLALVGCGFRDLLVRWLTPLEKDDT